MSAAAVPVASPPRDVVGYEGDPPSVLWPGGGRIAVSFVVHFQEGAELSVGDGDPTREPGGPAGFPLTTRDLGVETQFEYGSRVGYWRLLDLFEEHGVPVTFAACAVALERNPAAAKAMRERGHDVMAHGWRWDDATLLGREEERERIRLAVDSIARTTGERPVGWLCRSGPSVNTRELLVEEGGFLYDSDAVNDDLPYWTHVAGRKHLVVPHSLAINDIKFDVGFFGSPVEFERQLKMSFDRLYKEGARAPRMMSIGLHLRISGHAARTQAISNFLDHARSFPGVWFARRSEIARHWAEQQPDTVLPLKVY